MQRKITGLVVDDNASDRLIVKAALKKWGVSGVQDAENGAVAAAKIESSQEMGTPYDFVIMDWNMPSMPGLQLLRIIKGSYKLKNTKVIIMTATADLEVVQDAINYGADDFMVKPVTYDLLEQKMSKFFTREELHTIRKK